MKGCRAIAMLIIPLVASITTAQTVHFDDANLKAAVEAALGKSNPTQADMLGLQILKTDNKGIANLTGLEYALNLKRLELLNNQVSNLSPLSNLTNMEWLNVSKNKLSNIQPLANMTQLKELRLYENTISDISSLSGKVNLTRLELHKNNLSDISALSSLVNLNRLDLNGNSIVDISPLSHCTKLTWLHLWKNQVTDISSLSTLTRLTWLGAGSNNAITSVASLSGLTQLTFLAIEINQIQDISPLSGLTNLVTLRLGYNSISEVGALSNMTSLEEILLMDNQISDLAALTGSSMSNLNKLDVSNNPLEAYVCSDQIPTITANNPGIEIIGAVCTPPSLLVNFPDANLKAAVEAALGKENPTDTDMLGLTWLNAQGKGITDLTGLEYASNLTWLDLSKNAVTSLSPLAELVKLTTLYLNTNQISDLTPLAGLANLITLSLRENQISDLSPLAGLTQLKSLYLDRNQISNLNPLAGLVNATTLYLYSNQISDLSPLAGLANVTTLYLNSNQISDLSPLAGLANITALYLNSNQITDIGPLAGLANITALYLHNNQITDIGPLAGLANVTTLYLYSNQISDIGPLAGLADLLTLYLLSNQISDIGPLAGLTELEHLHLGGNDISDLSPLSGLTKLRYLYLYTNQISDVAPLAGLEALEILNLGTNKIQDASPLASLATLQTLSLYGNSISDVSPLTSLGSLVWVDLRVNPLGPDDLADLGLIEANNPGIELLYDSIPIPPAYAGGSGTADDPYQIADKQTLIDMGQFHYDFDKHFILTADIDLAGESFNTALIAPDTYRNNAWTYDGVAFSGVFDGGGHAVVNLTIDTQGTGLSFLGLFGNVASGGVVRNLGLENATVIAENSSRYVGGLVGQNHGLIDQCLTTGTVSAETGAYYVGGLVGSSEGGTLTDCYSLSSTTARDNCYYLGGLAGYVSDGSVAHCYAAGPVARPAAYEYVGGLVGRAGGATMDFCFWDVDSTGLDISSGGFPRSTSEMQTASTFIGWTDVWTLDEGRDYPRLAWENAAGVALRNVTNRTYAGSGTEDDPFILTSGEDVDCMAHRPDDWNGHFLLANDIDMSQIENYPPPGDFTGTIDGAGFTISNLTIDGPTYLAALIGALGTGGQIHDLKLGNIQVTGHHYVAFLVGNNLGTISNCHVIGKFDSTLTALNQQARMIGGLVGYNQGTIIESSTLFKSIRVGDECSRVGGLVGSHASGVIENCYSVSTDAIWLGENVSQAGGLIGLCDGEVRFCYTRTTFGGPYYKTWSDTGRLIGLNYVSDGIPVLCFYNPLAGGGSPFSDGGYGVDFGHYGRSAFLGWDPAVWTCDSGIGLPRLVSEDTGDPPLDSVVVRSYSGSGTEGDPFLLASADDLICMCRRPDDWTGYFALGNGIDMAGVQDYLPPGRFEGTIDGHGYAISNLVVNEATSGLGLVGHLTASGVIRNLTLIDTTITATYGDVFAGSALGGLAGLCEGTIENCFVSGSITGGDYVGGMAGYCRSGAIRSSGADVNVSGGSGVGSLAGSGSQVSITNCFGRGHVDGEWFVGGLVGFGAIIDNCYSAAAVHGPEGAAYIGGLLGYAGGACTDSFWDIDVSGQAESAGGIGLTTAQMQQLDTYLNAGWDFVNEVANGTEDLWKMPSGTGYPMLGWQVEDVVIEGFEAGGFSSLNWQHSGDADWLVTGDEAYTGNYSARAGMIGGGRTTSLAITLDCGAAEISFWRKVSCQSGWSGLEFYVDGQRKGSWDGEKDWEQVSFPVQAGTHTFRWTYFKLGWSSFGQDTAWLDDITFP